MDVKDHEGLTGLSFLVSNFGLDVVVTGLGNFTFDGSIIRISLESSWESSEDPNERSDGVLDSKWDSEAL